MIREIINNHNRSVREKSRLVVSFGCLLWCVYYCAAYQGRLCLMVWTGVKSLRLGVFWIPMRFLSSVVWRILIDLKRIKTMVSTLDWDARLQINYLVDELEVRLIKLYHSYEGCLLLSFIVMACQSDLNWWFWLTEIGLKANLIEIDWCLRRQL